MISRLGIEQDPLSRVSAVPDIRTFRMYRTQKLVDPPNTKAGSAGVYGRKHVVQLAAIKSLQAQRLPLRRIRMALANASTRRLEKIIRYPAGQSPTPPATKRSDTGPQKDRRWLQLQPADGVLLMVAEDVVTSSRSSSLRAIGEMVSASLLSCRT